MSSTRPPVSPSFLGVQQLQLQKERNQLLEWALERNYKIGEDVESQLVPGFMSRKRVYFPIRNEEGKVVPPKKQESNTFKMLDAPSINEIIDMWNDEDVRYVQGGLHYIVSTNEFWTIIEIYHKTNNWNFLKDAKWRSYFERASKDVSDVDCMFHWTPFGCAAKQVCPFKHQDEKERPNMSNNTNPFYSHDFYDDSDDEEY